MEKYIIFAILVYIAMKINSYFTSTICFFRGFSGIPCPSCGITRAYKLLLKGDLIGAFHMHPLFFIPIIIGILFFIKRMDIVYKHKYFLLILIFGVYIYRMIILFPNQEPMIFNNKAILPRIFNIISRII